jgi:coproporphyrinogen III oxidase-like Fe-S oxidoreductase|tara:strand:- start:1127 stop:1354 length:228 start_codon:yes stop_codon:yes gene_type:complete
MGEIMLDIKTFSMTIEKVVNDLKVPYMDAICWYCDKNDIEVETAAKLVNSKIKQIVAYEASELNLMKEKINSLPI